MAPMEHVMAGSLTLGTSSKWRQALFRKHFPTHAFTTLHADIDEGAITGGYSDRRSAPAEELALAIANAKASALVGQLSAGGLLLTCDQVVVHNGVIREKPGSKEECREYLKSYAKHPLVTVTAVVLTGADGSRVEGTDIATQYLKEIPNEVIEALVEKGDVLHCAGGITVEDPLLQPYLGVREGEMESIMGLPVALVARLLQQKLV